MRRPTQREAKARSQVAKARRDGLLDAPGDCESCGTPQRYTQGRYPVVIWHHHDYDRPLDVIPLCRSCHVKIHRGLLPEPRTGRIYHYAPVPSLENRRRIVREALRRGRTGIQGMRRTDFEQTVAELATLEAT